VRAMRRTRKKKHSIAPLLIESNDRIEKAIERNIKIYWIQSIKT
jgi:hypothetical protein